MNGFFICLLMGLVNIYCGIMPPHTVAWLNWLTAGFCFGVSYCCGMQALYERCHGKTSKL